MKDFDSLVSVNFQGTVVLFGREASGTSADIYYNVLGRKDSSSETGLAWNGFVKLVFPPEVRQAGMSLLTFGCGKNTITPAREPFRVVTDQNYISVIQQSTRGTLYVNRFRLLQAPSSDKASPPLYTLSPAWEVRYARSCKSDIPADDSDIQDFIDPEGTAFIEPAIELSMLKDVANGAFDVILLPAAGARQYAWQFFVVNAAGTGIDLFHFLLDDNGLFDCEGKAYDKDGTMLPDSSFCVQATDTLSPLSVTGPPRAAMYTKHEKVARASGSSTNARRSTRVMLTLPVLYDAKPATVTIDSAVSVEGAIAAVCGTLTAANLSPAHCSLRFNGIASLAFVPPKGKPDPLAIAGPYTMKLLFAPHTLQGNMLVVSGKETDQTKLAPYISITDGDKIEAGFGNGEAKVFCRTLHQALSADTWTEVVVSYTGTGNTPFTILINGAPVALSACSTAKNPYGKPVCLVGNSENGFNGALKKLEILTESLSVVNLACEEVDYTANPPLTPNLAESGVTVSVSGAILEPSTSPLASNMDGTFHIDANGLTYSVGLAPFIRQQAPACLIDGSDGLLHLYYKGDNDRFTVARFSKTSARAAFFTDWSTRWPARGEKAAPSNTPAAPDVYLGWSSEQWAPAGPRLLSAPDESQTGFLDFIAHRVGTYMNNAAITITPSAVSPLLCDISVLVPGEVGKEMWTGLPRALESMARIWNGFACGDPEDPDAQHCIRPYFDYAGGSPSALVPARAEENGSYFLFTSAPHIPLPLASVQVAEGKTKDFVNLSLETKAPPRWPKDATLKQAWPDVPVGAQALVKVLDGRAPSYNYSGVTTPGNKVYGLRITPNTSDEKARGVIFFTREEEKAFSLSVSACEFAQLCTVTICGSCLPGVPREESLFAATINGDNPNYAYPSGYLEGPPTAVYALSDGLGSHVADGNAGPPPVAAFAYARLFCSLYQGSQPETAAIVTQEKTPCRILQKAVLVYQNRESIIKGSMLFSAQIDTLPSNGGQARVNDTSAYPHECAPCWTPGVNGGWMPLTPDFCLAFNEKSYVHFNVSTAFSPAERLALVFDMTLAAWLNPQHDTINTSMRALSYSVADNQEHPGENFRHMIGTKQGHALVLNSRTYMSKGISFSGLDLTAQIYVYREAGADGRLLSVSDMRGSRDYIALSVAPSGKAQLAMAAIKEPLESAKALPAEKWVCLTVVAVNAGAGKTTLKLAVDAEPPVTKTVTNTFDGQLGVFTVGSSMDETISCRINGAAFWQRGLTDAEVCNSVLYGYSNDDSMLGIRWNFTEGAGTELLNAAATGEEYNGKVINPSNPPWHSAGAFQVPYVGRDDLVLASNHILRGWTHVALVSKQGHGLKLGQRHYGKVTDAEAFNQVSEGSLEVWVSATAKNEKQVLLEKTDCYSLYIDTSGNVCLRVHYEENMSGGGVAPFSMLDLKAPLALKQACHVAAVFSCGSINELSVSQQGQNPEYYVYAAIYINGTLLAEKNIRNLSKSGKIKAKDSSFYIGAANNGFFFEGLLSHVRVWKRTLGADEIKQTSILRIYPTSKQGLVAAWDFEQGSGTVAVDSTGSHRLELTSNQLWSLWQDVAQAELYVNGAASQPLRLLPNDVGGYGDSQLTFGGVLANEVLTHPFTGSMSDIRLYSVQLTEQQIRESMNRPLDGAEDNLTACWRLQTGSGTMVHDITGHGNNGSLMGKKALPQWKSPSAPLGDEPQYIVNALDTKKDCHAAALAGQPAIIDYAETQVDAYGKLCSTMKRAGFFLSADGRTKLERDYKVGELERVFVGQVQSKPTIIGYIEGGPPLPSENQTLAYWDGDKGGAPRSYAGISSATYQESTTKTWSFSGDNTSAYGGSFNINGGFALKSTVDSSAGLGLEVGTRVVETSIHAGATWAMSGTKSHQENVSRSHAHTTGLTTSMSPAGVWEAENAIFNPCVGRRYIQDNIGIALVKSSTADLYMLALKGTQTPVSYTLAPNETIPEDTNIIDFPLNPRYVKNGTLDGKVGLMNDVHYPDADTVRGSYFKPVEAYALKARIERQEQRLKTYYAQFESFRNLAEYPALKTSVKENDAYDFSKNSNLFSLYNNYVWTAAGGLHKEEHSFANAYAETYTGTSSLSIAGGIKSQAEVVSCAGGFYIEADTVHGNTWTLVASKSDATANGFSLDCSVQPTDFLHAPLLEKSPEGKLTFTGYETETTPGKVDGYRFMSFLLAPAEENFTVLNQVIDKGWLQNSSSPAAAAMREALGTPCSPWRILYRTTYVSRIPAAFQPVPDNADMPDITPPANTAANAWLIQIVRSVVPTLHPTRGELGTAINAVLGIPGGQAGLLCNIIPWWSDFYTAAQVYGSTPFKQLAALRSDLLHYMYTLYAAESFLAICSS